MFTQVRTAAVDCQLAIHVKLDQIIVEGWNAKDAYIFVGFIKHQSVNRSIFVEKML